MEFEDDLLMQLQEENKELDIQLRGIQNINSPSSPETEKMNNSASPQSERLVDTPTLGPRMEASLRKSGRIVRQDPDSLIESRRRAEELVIKDEAIEKLEAEVASLTLRLESTERSEKENLLEEKLAQRDATISALTTKLKQLESSQSQDPSISVSSLRAELARQREKYSKLKTEVARMEDLLKDYEEQSRKTLKELRNTKEMQGVLLDSISIYRAQSQQVSGEYQKFVCKVTSLLSAK